MTHANSPAAGIVAALIAVAGIAVGTTASAQSSAAKPTTPSKATTHQVVVKRQPFYLSGVWVIADSFMDKQDGTSVAAPGRLSEANPDQIAMMLQLPVLKGDYEKRRLQAHALMAQGKPVDDTGALCLPQGMPAFWIGPYAFEILQTDKQINISQEWNEQTRRIYIDGRTHPRDYDPSYNGHSIGHWQGDELLIDTVGIREDTKIGAESHHSDAIHIVERIKKTAPDLIRVEMTVYDPKAFMQPWVAVYRLRHKPGMEMQEYSCEDNNRNTVDANGVTQAVIAPKQ
jgi:hypothetical protein